MIQRKTILDQIEITRSGRIQLRFALLLVEDDVELDCKWHRTAIEPGGDVDAQIALVNEHLQAMGKAPIEADRIPELKAVTGIAHTKERIQQHRDAMSASTRLPS